jgi:hypothetical protein
MPRFGGAFLYEPSAHFGSLMHYDNRGLSIRVGNFRYTAAPAAVLAISTD